MSASHSIGGQDAFQDQFGPVRSASGKSVGGDSSAKFYTLLAAFLWLGLPCAALLSLGLPDRFVYPPFVGLLVVFFYLSDHLRSLVVARSSKRSSVVIESLLRSILLKLH